MVRTNDVHIRAPAALAEGENEYIGPADPHGMGFSVLRLTRALTGRTDHETCLVLLSGKGRVRVGGEDHDVERSSLLDEEPWTFLLPAGEDFAVLPEPEMELAVIRTENERRFSPRVFAPDAVDVERRGEDLVDGACFRLVKTVFDHSTMAESNLVVGEVVNQPGRWSSYPPHHHPQPELYYYRFVPGQGYGFSQLGDRAIKVSEGSLVCIPPDTDHPQVAAPGYAMWYLWVVRHLPDDPYTGFTFDPRHEWTLDPGADVWRIGKG
ncbi:MAG: 5-deoxy-glucuronate isomerase [Candidatus Undinarchaeales archaeon]|jgi:5-deoxy-glucuronate isomerase|nr:5-deoxy-glucuronate isomerase [Candidatus Undinarchaeales archaeon]MDP7493326.1 5-deoxy-glucuronate isomerase [Candidatus Undinarchaeales archaeon]